MSEENKAAAAAGAAPAGQGDEIKNLKAEVNRKLDNTNAQLNALLEQMKKSTAPAPKKPEAPQKKVSVYEDEDAFAENIRKETKKEILEEIGKANQMNARQQSTIASLVKDFPELNDGDSELTKKAVEIFNSMGDDEKSSPVAYRAAVKEAALELDLKPKGKRRASEDSGDDSFTLGNGRSGDRRSDSPKKLDRRTAIFAEALGVDTKKVEARLNKRKSFTRWE